MSRCKVCGCLGWLFSVSETGICSSCTHILTLEVAERSRRIEDSLRSADQTVNPGTQIARLDETLAQLEALSRYEQRGIHTIEGSPAALMDEVRRRKDEVVGRAAQIDVSEAMLRVQETPFPEKKISLYNALLLRLAEYRRRMDKQQNVLELEARVKEAVKRIRLNIPLDKARIAENRGQREAALACYRDALNFLRSSDPERAALACHIPEIEERIRALDQKPAA